MKYPSFLGKDDVAVGYEISGTLRLDSDRTLSTRNTMMHLQAEGRAALDAELASDPVLDAVPAAHRAKLVAKREGIVYRFDLRLRGEGETPFFDD